MNYWVKYEVKNVKPQHFLIGVFAVLLIATPELAKGADDESRKIFQRFDFSYIAGGQVHNDKFIYNPGLSLNMTYGVYLSKDVSLGFGLGYQSFENERFIPVYGEILGYRKHKDISSPFIRMQIGYGIGWSVNFPDNINYKYSGGPFIDIGMGRKLILNHRYAVQLQWSYRLQFASLQYETYGAEIYSQNLNYDMVVITLGFMTSYY